ncbi:hypothetical protein N5C38_25520 [Pseudomonas chengduensis]|jgi:hypothetical protein|nr:hypothetical protein [Pseudomonas chengduensis]MDH0625957.1 hypothetical protein [Pseudomonas chengduensis]MDH1214381.1 hypothetical protein [Pseudomonas chengduensis]MDH1282467.1 hypothetical protein [Pseudomonas chengduensis]MDH1668506.1 hypothetical protein [Pseudomonas chengduensis]|tara:strand:- start:1352 stop:2251 length:900 start_codon:yes stop_codon:yes gene_type:complete
MDATKFNLRRSVFSPGNAIFIVDCLSESELQTGRTRLQGLHDLLLAKDPERFDYNKEFIRRFEASSAAQFARCFEQITGACKLGIRPVIFVDAHGHAEKGLRMPRGDFVGWGALLEELRKVIQRTDGELTVIVAACHSMKAVESLTSLGRLPFAFYYGYSSTVKAYVLNEETKMIYESLLSDGGATVINAKKLQLKCFSEYDHVEDVLAFTLLIAKAPAVLAEKVPTFSRNKLRASVDKATFERGLPLSGARSKVNRMLNSGDICIQFVQQMMHATPRRKRVIEDIQAYIQDLPAHPIP